MGNRQRTVTEYRVLSERECRESEHKIRTDKRYRSLKAVRDRIGRLTSKEPWRHYGSRQQRERGPDDFVCCSGYECSCGGYTLRQETEEKRKELPPIVSVRVEARQITYLPWAAQPSDLPEDGR